MTLTRLETYFARLEGDIAEIAHALRARLDAHGPHLTLSMAGGHPCWEGRAPVASVIAQPGHCNLQLWSGAQLAEQFARIEGRGKARRHVKIHRLDEIDDELDDILEAAIGLDRDAQGHGSPG